MDDDKSYSGQYRWAQEPAADRLCDWPDCDGHGQHRAPKSRDNLRDYYWFCLDHVRDYNKSWNYFDGMEDDEFTAMTWSTAKWDRPTWPLGSGKGGNTAAPNGGMNAAWQASHIREAARQFRGNPMPGDVDMDDYFETSSSRRLLPEDRDALKVLGLKSTATLQDVKKRFKQLVKRFHPDANGGAINTAQNDDPAQDQLREVIAAYSHLVKSSNLTNST